MLQLHDAIERLAQVESRLARVVDCRFFGGMNDQEIAEVLEVTPAELSRGDPAQERGRGGMARVYLTRDLKHNGDVAASTLTLPP